jgi:hypothetical protein
MISQYLKDAVLGEVKKHLVSQNLTLRLFCNDIEPKSGDSSSKYSEANFAGYTPSRLDGWRWRTGAIDGKGALLHDEHKFESTQDRKAPALVYGFFITYPDGTLAFADRFGDAPNAIYNFKDAIIITPTVVCL